MRSPQERLDDSAPAVTALRAAKFADAERAAASALGQDPHNARAAAVRAIATYQQAGERLVTDLGELVVHGIGSKGFDHELGRLMWRAFLDRLAAVERDLAIADRDPAFALELCLACWEHDWNRSGEIDDGDRTLFELEYDGTAAPSDGMAPELPAGDPRRRPTYRFDAGDIAWARAMTAFQRAIAELVLAYRWNEADKLFGDDDVERITLRLGDAAGVVRAHRLILDGLAHSDRSRAAYLAETDDDREWVPNPRQKSYAMPLAVTPDLYATWEAVVRDVRRLLASEEGVSVRALVDWIHRPGAPAPDAFLDIGRMLRQPKDIVIDLRRGTHDRMEQVLRGLTGNGFRGAMRPSPVLDRLQALMGSRHASDDTFERKLRYFLWIN